MLTKIHAKITIIVVQNREPCCPEHVVRNGDRPLRLKN